MPASVLHAFTPAPVRMGRLRSAATAVRATRLALSSAPPVPSDLVTGKPPGWYAGKLPHTARAGHEVNRPSGSGTVHRDTPAPPPIPMPAPMSSPPPIPTPVPFPVPAPAVVPEPAPAE
jgi:hypothetical protein